MAEWVDLFNGRDLEGWKARREPHTWQTCGGVSLDPTNPRAFVLEPGTGVMINSTSSNTSDLHTVQSHGSCQLHVEFVVAEHSNSGVYLMGQYEVQVLDSWGTPDTELKYGTNGGIYARHNHPVTGKDYDGHPPLTNASLRPGQWQTFDIIFHAPRFDASGTKTAKARFERVTLNGKLIHENVEVNAPTGGAWNPEDIPLGPLRLQGDHGPVAYRNLRMRAITD